MEITYKLVGLRNLQRATNLAPGVMFNRQVEAMNRSVSLVKSLVMLETGSGPGHFGFHAVDKWTGTIHTGPRRLVGVIANSAVQVRFKDAGTKPHEIHATKGVLSINHGESYAMVVRHPGIKARHIAKKALVASKTAIKVFFFDAARGVVQSMATSGD